MAFTTLKLVQIGPRAFKHERTPADQPCVHFHNGNCRHKNKGCIRSGAPGGDIVSCEHCLDYQAKECPGCKKQQRHAMLPIEHDGKPRKVCHLWNHGLGDNTQGGVFVRHWQHHFPHDEQHAVAQRGKHSIFTGQVAHVHVTDFRDKAPRGQRFNLELDHPWLNPDRCYSDAPSTKAVHALRERYGLAIVPELLRYHIHVPEETRKHVEAWIARNVGGPFVVLHYQGVSWHDRKNLTQDDVLPLIEELRRRQITPIVMDMDRRGYFPDNRRHGAFLLDAGDALWRGVRDAATMAGLMHLAALTVMIDSGPGKVAASVPHTPCLTVWRKLHPLHFSDLDYGQVLHLVPHNHQKFLRGPGKAGGLQYFREHYRHRTYRAEPGFRGCLGADIKAAAIDLLEAPRDALRTLVARSNRYDTFWPFVEQVRGMPAPLVVETGCQRQENDFGAGQSTTIFGRALEPIGGRLISLDLTPERVDLARRLTCDLPVDVVLTDSRDWLRSHQGPPIDALYLDSCDVCFPGFEDVCLQEAQLALPHLAPHAPILIDDTHWTHRGWEGKGKKAVPWLLERGWRLAGHRYQVLLQPPLQAPAPF